MTLLEHEGSQAAEPTSWAVILNKLMCRPSAVRSTHGRRSPLKTGRTLLKLASGHALVAQPCTLTSPLIESTQPSHTPTLLSTDLNAASDVRTARAITPRFSERALSVPTKVSGLPRDFNNTNEEDESELERVLNSLQNPYHHGVPSIRGGFLVDLPVILWKAPHHMSQSRLCGRPIPSSACTLIALQMAEYMYKYRIFFPTYDYRKRKVLRDRNVRESGKLRHLECPTRLVNTLVNGIVDGNELYTRAHKIYSSNGNTFTVPEAICAHQDKWHEVQYVSSIGPLGENVAYQIRGALTNEHLLGHMQLFFLLLVYERCVLIVVQRANHTIGIIDSHTHFSRGIMEVDANVDFAGAFIACSSLNNLEFFTHHLAETFFPESRCLAPELQAFELSLIQFKGPTFDDHCVTDREKIIFLSPHESIFLPAKRPTVCVTKRKELCRRARRLLLRDPRTKRAISPPYCGK